MNADSLRTLLPEAEGGDRERLDAICLKRSAWVDDVVEFLHDLVNIVRVAVAWHKTCVEDLQAAVEHPSTGSTLRMTLSDTSEKCP